MRLKKKTLCLTQINVHVSEKMNITQVRVNSNEIFITGHVKNNFIGHFEKQTNWI